MTPQIQTFHYQGIELIQKVAFSPPFQYQNSFQNEGCFVYMTSGEAKVSSSTEKLHMSTKEALLLQCNTYIFDFIAEAKDENITMITVHLLPEVLKKIYSNELPKLIEQQEQNIETKHIVDEAIVARFIDSLQFYFENPSLVNDDLLELKIKELILLLIQTRNVSSVRQLLENIYTERKVSLVEIVENHLYSEMSIENLATWSNMSVSSFKREFKKHFDDSPAHYMNEKRLDKAKELLTLSKMAIADVAYQAGFNDPLYFSRLFKRREGITSSIFRSNHQD